MRCPSCEQENRDVARFCQYCGASLTVAETPEDSDAETEFSELERSLDLPQEAMPEATEFVQENEPEALDGVDDQETVESSASPEPVEQLETAPSQEGCPDKDALAGDLILDDQALEEPCESLSLSVGLADEHTAVPLDSAEQASEQAAGSEGQGSKGGLDESLEDELEQEPDIAPSEPAELEPIPPQEMASSPPEETEEALEPIEPLAEVEQLAAAELLPWSDRPEPVQTCWTGLEPGSVVNGRYQVIEVLQVGDQEARYRVRDLARCPRCGSVDNSPDEAFCVSCGALMEQKPVAILLERAAMQEDEFAQGQDKEYIEHNGRHYWVWQEMEQEPAQDGQPLMRLTLGQMSDMGQVRELDEDSLFVLTMSSTYESVTRQLGLFVVADGMGGHQGGEVASRIAIQHLAQSLLRDVFAPELAGNALSPDVMLEHLESAVHTANERVYLERQKRETDMGTTITVALVVDWTLYLAHVGDCRAYCWGQNGLQQLTTDHSIVAGMVAAGTIEPDEIYTHPQRSVIYRNIGDRPAVEVDLSTLLLGPDDRLVLCCDGLWEMIRDEGIEDVLLRESDPQKACEIMVEQANRAGGSDNISVIIVQF